jgi:hypothetical protein
MKVDTLIGKVEFYIIKVNMPFLLSLANIDKLGVYFNNLINILIILKGNIPVI